MTRKGLKDKDIKRVVLPDVSGDDNIINTQCARPLTLNGAFSAQMYLWVEDDGTEEGERRIEFHLPGADGPRQKKQVGNVVTFELPQKAKDRRRQFFSIMDVADNIITRESLDPAMPLNLGNYVPYRIVSGHVYKEDKDAIVYEVDDALVIYGLDRFYRWLCIPVGVLLQEASKAGAKEDDYYHIVYMADINDLDSRGILDYEHIGGVPVADTYCEEGDGIFHDLDSFLNVFFDDVFKSDTEDTETEEDECQSAEEDDAEDALTEELTDTDEFIAIPCTLCVERGENGEKRVILRDDDDGTPVSIYDEDADGVAVFPDTYTKNKGLFTMLSEICDERDLFMPDLFTKNGDVLYVVFTSEEFVTEILDEGGDTVEAVEVRYPAGTDIAFGLYTREEWERAKARGKATAAKSDAGASNGIRR